MAATDNGGSGVEAIRYTTNGSDPTTTSALYSAPFTVTQTTTVKYRSWDVATNVEATKTQVITITTGGTGGTIEKAAGRPTSASSPKTPASHPNSANDGDPETRWSSLFQDNQWWQVDLGSSRAITSATITFNQWAWPKTYTISTSLDGTTWTVITNATLTTYGTKTSTFTQTNARYVRVTGLTRGTSAGTSIEEALIYGPTDGTPPPVDTTAPVTSIACNSAACTAGSYTGPVTVALTATDVGGSGVAATRTRQSDPTTTSALYSAPFSVTQTTTVKYRSWDVATNVEATKTQVITITTTPPVDTTAPVTSIVTAPPAQPAATRARSRSRSPPPTTAAPASQQPGTPPTAATPPRRARSTAPPFSVTQTTTVKYRSWDVATNVEATKTQVITVTAAPPGSTIEKAAGRPTSASSSENAGFAPQYANDGDPETRWSSLFQDNQWWQVDLGSSRTITSASITFNQWAWPKTYTISTSPDATTWTVINTTTLTSSGTKTSTFNQTNARYIRITGLTRGTSAGTSIEQALIYGPHRLAQPILTCPSRTGRRDPPTRFPSYKHVTAARRQGPGSGAGVTP